MPYRLLTILVPLALASTVQAGPWLREEGTTFSAVSASTTYYLDTSSQTYLEYGLTQETTLVGDLNMTRQRYSDESGHATVSLRRALSKPDATSKLAYELGVGVGWAGSEALPHLRTGLSWGRGIKWREKSGWATVEAAVIWGLNDAQNMTKLDTTAGINFTDVTAGMIQLYTTEMDGKIFAIIAPSLVFTPRDSKFRIQIGMEGEIGNLDNTALKLGLWREF